MGASAKSRLPPTEAPAGAIDAPLVQALRRALACREPGLEWEHAFGGVFYLFLRGMTPGSTDGIHFSRPTPDEIAEFLS